MVAMWLNFPNKNMNTVDVNHDFSTKEDTERWKGMELGPQNGFGVFYGGWDQTPSRCF